jgi:prepilin-type processing-associated H-X9-DG protein
MPAANGPMFAKSKTSFKNVTDGTSKTAAFSEKILGDGNNSLATLESDTFQPESNQSSRPTWGPAGSPWPDTANNVNDSLLPITKCMDMDWTDISKQGGAGNVGAPWLRAYHSTTKYWHILTPNTRSCMYPGGRIATTAGSRHTVGVNVMMCDGSVRFIVNEVDQATWWAMGTRSRVPNEPSTVVLPGS